MLAVFEVLPEWYMAEVYIFVDPEAYKVFD
jgi:hypothetical protein